MRLDERDRPQDGTERRSAPLEAALPSRHAPDEHNRELADPHDLQNQKVEQEQEWDKLLGWARRRYDVDFVTTSGLLHVAQPPATVERLSHAVAALDSFRLAGLFPLVTIGGSMVAALAVLEKAIAPDEAWHAISIDERWQLEQWGSDVEAETALDNRRGDFLAAAKFLDLLD